jgi:hypothetical protein
MSGGLELHLTFPGHFKILHLEMSLISKTACRRAQISTIWVL